MPRIAVEAWDPEYGASFPYGPFGLVGELSSAAAEVDPSVELPRAKWSPIRSKAAATEQLRFVDGVRRIDALVWITNDAGTTRMGLCASYAAGVVEAGERAEISRIEMRRALFTSLGDVPPLETEVGRYETQLGSGESLSQLSSDLQERLRRLEVDIASATSPSDVVVVDGPLSAHHARGRRIGYVKSHRVRYLDDELERVVHRLEAGERTPLFRTTTSWSRYSAYLRLDSSKAHPFAGVVRLEFSAEEAPAEITGLANLAAATLPQYASVPHKDPRAPQNLFPIGGLERELRRRLGDPQVVHRALRLAASRFR